MKSYFYVKLSALLLIMFSNICCIYSLNLKKNEFAEKKQLSNDKKRNKESKVYSISEKIISLKNPMQNGNNLNNNNDFKNTIETNDKSSLNRIYTNTNSKSGTILESFLNNNRDENILINDLYYRNNANSTSNITLSPNIKNARIILKEIKPESKLVVQYSAGNNKTFDFDGFNDNNVNNFKKIFLGLSIYSQLFLVFSVISLLKLYEEYFKIKTIHCENIYSHFKDLTPENKEALSANTQNYIFTSGKPEIKLEARDEIFDYPKEKKFVKIERIVEIYRADEKCWRILGRKALKSNLSYTLEELGKTPDMIEEMDEDEKDDKFKLDINTLEQIYTFPKIFSKTFFGKAELNDIHFSNCQLEALKDYERIKFPHSNQFIESFLEEVKTKKNYSSNFVLERKNEYLIIYPIENQSKNENEMWKMRIHLRGFAFEKVSFLGQVHRNQFRTIHIPFSNEALDKTNDNYDDVNKSLGMIAIPNFQFDLCNLFFCFCFSGPVVYKQNEESTNAEDDLSVGRINWIEEEILTKQDFINKKHDISYFYLYLNRLIFFLILAALFYFLPNPTPMFTRMFQLPKEKLEKHYFFSALLFAKIFTLVTIIYSKISIKVKHCFNVFVVMTFFVFLIIYAVWEIIYLAEL